jgi:hypothetical protein
MPGLRAKLPACRSLPREAFRQREPLRYACVRAFWVPPCRGPLGCSGFPTPRGSRYPIPARGAQFDRKPARPETRATGSPIGGPPHWCGQPAHTLGRMWPVARRPSPFARRPSLVALRSSPFARRPSLVALRSSPFARRSSLVARRSSLVARRSWRGPHA